MKPSRQRGLHLKITSLTLIRIYLVLANPRIKCLSKEVYFNNKHFSDPYPKKISSDLSRLFNLMRIRSDRNDLEKIVFKRYPKIKILNYFIKKQENCIFSRMTGSGSTCIGYFNKSVSAKKAKKNILRKFPSYWCITAKTI